MLGNRRAIDILQHQGTYTIVYTYTGNTWVVEYDIFNMYVCM